MEEAYEEVIVFFLEGFGFVCLYVCLYVCIIDKVYTFYVFGTWLGWYYLLKMVDDGIQDLSDTLCKDSIQWSDIGNGMALEEDGKNTRQKKIFIKE